MAGLTGQVLRERTLKTAAGREVAIRVIRPESTVENIAALRRASDEWRRYADNLPPVYGGCHYRGAFASDVAFLAAATLERRSAGYYVLLATSGDGDKLLGILIYQRLQDGTFDWSLQAAAPENIPGCLNPDPLRGVGNELTGEGLAQIIAENCTTIHLTALDAAAARHWQHIGWVPDTSRRSELEPFVLHCPDARVAAARLAHTEWDEPELGEEVAAVDRGLLRRVALEPEMYDEPGVEAHMREQHGWYPIGPTGERERARLGEMHRDEHRHVAANRLPVEHRH